MPRPRHKNREIIRLNSHPSRQSLCFVIVVVVISLRPGFHYMANATTTTQKQSDYEVEQSSFTLIALFDSKLVVVVVVSGLMETRLKLCYQVFDLFFIFSALFLETESRGLGYLMTCSQNTKDSS